MIDQYPIDEKKGKHDQQSRHSCAEAKQKWLKLREKKEQREQEKSAKIAGLVKARDNLENEKKAAKFMMDKQRQELENIRKEMLKWKAQALEKQKDKLQKEMVESQSVLLKEKKEKMKFKAMAEEEEKKVGELEREKQKLEEKIGFVNIWQWHDYGDIWKSYDHDTNNAIEKLKIGGNYTFTVAANDQTYQVTKTGQKMGTQINTLTKVSRNIRKQKIERGINQVKYPEWWNMDGLAFGDGDNNNNNIEPGASATYAKPRLVTKSLTRHPASSVVAAFNKTAKTYVVTKVESIENQMLYDAFWGARSKMIKLIGDNKLNERELWHGTGNENVMKLVEQEGFRKEFNRNAMYGKGTYFARDASYSVGYSSCNNGVYKMFQCKVLTGEMHPGNGGYELNSWPKKKSGQGLIYDSLVDNKSNPSIFVIHDDVRAYPMFVVTFKKK